MIVQLFFSAFKRTSLRSSIFLVVSLSLSILILGCATPYNYERFRAENPKSILILPPTNQSTDIRGTYSYLSTVTSPVAEKGFYVFPVVLIDTMMKENGLPSANEMHEASVRKIKEIINPDAILYLNLEDYGTKMILLTSETRVTVSGKLVSAKTGQILWEGKATADDSSSSSGGGLTEKVINSVIKQAVNSTVDYARDIAKLTNTNLFYSEQRGLLDGPYRHQLK